MPLLRNGALVQDNWTQLGLEDAVPAGGNVTLPLERLTREWDALASHPGLLGAVAQNVTRAETLQPYLPRLSLIILPFPAFSDGRAYSLARQLRELGYRGELRAAGNVLPDQLQFMRQVGFDTFEIGERFPLETWVKAARQMSLTYVRGLYRPAGEAEVWSIRQSEPGDWEEQPHAG